MRIRWHNSHIKLLVTCEDRAKSTKHSCWFSFIGDIYMLHKSLSKD